MLNSFSALLHVLPVHDDAFFARLYVPHILKKSKRLQFPGTLKLNSVSARGYDDELRRINVDDEPALEFFWISLAGGLFRLNLA